MMKKLRGRNLAHPGCLIGITTGLILGIVIAGVMAAILNIDLNTDLLIWLGLTVALGAIGWIIGNRLSSRFPALDEENQLSTNNATSEEGLEPQSDVTVKQ